MWNVPCKLDPDAMAEALIDIVQDSPTRAVSTIEGYLDLGETGRKAIATALTMMCDEIEYQTQFADDMADKIEAIKCTLES